MSAEYGLGGSDGKSRSAARKCTADVGVREVMRGRFVGPTVKPLNGAEIPFEVMTVTVREPGVALGSIVMATGILESFPPAMILAVTQLR